LAATQQLQRVLQTQLAVQSQRRSRRWSILGGLALAALAFAGGTVVAYLNQPRPLLALSSGERPKIKRFDSVKDQYAYAQMAVGDQEAAWLAVAEYFPPENNAENLRYARLATKGLAAQYLSANRYQEALPLYRSLANVEQSEADFQLAGIAGQAVIYDQLGDDQRATEYLAQLSHARPNLQARIGGLLAGKVNELFEKHQPQGE
jgi:hypothetical protein